MSVYVFVDVFLYLTSMYIYNQSVSWRVPVFKLCECLCLQLIDFDVKGLIAHGSGSAVFLATCKQARIHDKTKVYKLKAIFNIFRYATMTQVGHDLCVAMATQL